MKAHFEEIAAYNRWANQRLYAMATAVPDADYRRNVGAFFGSLHGTLNHLLVTDRIWMRRLTGVGEHPSQLNAILFDDFAALHDARVVQDGLIIDFVAGRADADFERDVEYHTLGGARHEQKLRHILAHLFNHQTHHRGQAHTVLSIITGEEPQSLDLLVFQRSP